MPLTKQAIKRVRQAEKRREQNRTQRSKMRTLIKAVTSETDKEKAEEALKNAVSYIDRMSNKGIIHPNNGARKKAQLTKYVNNL
ncbi:MAG: 30S ribosomal protein S20 [Balneolaceae bacterium]|nr:30S ribosomal protein S20 [Balneolaceae bacterium]